MTTEHDSDFGGAYQSTPETEDERNDRMERRPKPEQEDPTENVGCVVCRAELDPLFLKYDDMLDADVCDGCKPDGHDCTEPYAEAVLARALLPTGTWSLNLHHRRYPVIKVNWPKKPSALQIEQVDEWTIHAWPHSPASAIYVAETKPTLLAALEHVMRRLRERCEPGVETQIEAMTTVAQV